MFKKFAMAAICLTATQVGFGAVEVQDQDKDFVWYCESDEATKAQKITVKEIFHAFRLNPEWNTCKEAYRLMTKNPVALLAFHEIPITDLAPLRGLENLGYLECSVCNQTAAETMPNLPNLVHLAIIDGDLASIPNLERFPKLGLLNLSDNPIEELGDINQLKKIEKLYLGGTKLTKFDFLTKLPNLKSIGLSKMTRSILDELPILPNIVSFTGNNLRTSDYSFLTKMNNIESLELRDNNLETVDVIQYTPKLKDLDLAYNKIKTIPAGKLPSNLTKLDLSINPLEDFNFLEELRNLEGLFLARTGFNSWQSIHHLLNKLKNLWLTDNPLSESDIGEGSPVKWDNMELLFINDTEFTSLSLFKNIKAPKLEEFRGPASVQKTEEKCPTSGVPAPVAQFCAENRYE